MRFSFSLGGVAFFPQVFTLTPFFTTSLNEYKRMGKRK